MGHVHKIDYPSPSATEQQLLSEQISALRQQTDALTRSYEQQKLLEPLFYEAAGIVPQYDDAGRLTGYTQAPKTEAEQSAERILQMQLDREEKALKGELPLNPALEREMTQQGTDFEEQMRRQGLKPGDTGYDEARNKFNESREAIYEGARRGDISMYEGMSLARQLDLDRRTQMSLQNYSLVPGYSQASGLSFGQAAQNYANPLNYEMQERQNEMMENYYKAWGPTFTTKYLMPIHKMVKEASGEARGWMSMMPMGGA